MRKVGMISLLALMLSAGSARSAGDEFVGGLVGGVIGGIIGSQIGSSIKGVGKHQRVLCDPALIASLKDYYGFSITAISDAHLGIKYKEATESEVRILESLDRCENGRLIGFHDELNSIFPSYMRIRLESRPPTANVYFGENYVGDTKMDLYVKSDVVRDVRLEKDGFKPCRIHEMQLSTIALSPKIHRLLCTLNRIPEEADKTEQ